MAEAYLQCCRYRPPCAFATLGQASNALPIGHDGEKP